MFNKCPRCKKRHIFGQCPQVQVADGRVNNRPFTDTADVSTYGAPVGVGAAAGDYDFDGVPDILEMGSKGDATTEDIISYGDDPEPVADPTPTPEPAPEPVPQADEPQQNPDPDPGYDSNWEPAPDPGYTSNYEPSSADYGSSDSSSSYDSGSSSSDTNW